ncbi:MAG: agmatinase [Planctomycetota bacterium]|jgi:agmatinase
MPSPDSTRTTLPNARERPRFAGIATFCRFPRLEDVAPAQQPVDWALYGVPFDGGVSYRPGARFGPRAIREASQYVKPVHLESGVDLARVFSLADAGDAPVRPYSCRDTLDVAATFAQGLGDPAQTHLFAIGGDHSIAYANIRATWERRGRPSAGLAVLHFDAHLDTVDAIWGEQWTHASPFVRAIEDGLIDPSRMLSVGIRGPLNAITDLDYGRAKGIELVTCDDWRRRNGVERISSFLARLGDDETYLTFDIDCIDPAFAPGTGTPSCGGFAAAEAFDLLRDCAGVNLVGADLVEVLPERDPAGVTALLASHIIFEILCAAASGRS